MNYIKKRIQSFGYAFQGLGTLFRETPNAQIQLIAAIVAVTMGFVLHISSEEWLAVIIVIGLVLALEAINSSLETLADYACNKEIHPSIRKVKDLAAAGVLLAALAALVVGIVLFLPKIISIMP
jgi:diacylglycerol kinase